MARTTVDLTPVSPTARGIGRQGSGAVQYRANPNAGSSAELLANSLNVVLDASQRNDRRKIDEANKKFELEFDGYVSKALQGDNTTGIEELDTLYPDMSMTRKLMILKASGKATMERDEEFQSLVASIGAPSTDEFGNSTGFDNTLDGINSGYASAEQYIRDKYGEANGAYVSGMLGYLDGQRSAQVQQYVAEKRAVDKAATVDEFSNTDKALAASGDWEALARQDDIWAEAGKNQFIQGKDRNAYITNAAYEQSKLNRDIRLLESLPEEYKGVMRGKPQLWQTYIENTKREIDALKAQDIDTKLKADEDAVKARKIEIRKKMLNNETLSENDQTFISIYADLSGSRDRLEENSKTPPDVSKLNLATELNQLSLITSQDELDDLGLTLEVLGDPDKLEQWASERPGIRIEDSANLIKAATSAGRVQEVKTSVQYTNFKESMEGILSPLAKTNYNEGDTLPVGSNDVIAYRSAKEFAEKEYQELLEIAIDKNGGLPPTKEELRNIKNAVLETLNPYVDSILKDPAVSRNPTAVNLAIKKGTEKIDVLAIKIDGKSYKTLSNEEAQEALSQGKRVKRASTDRNTAAYYRFIIVEN